MRRSSLLAALPVCMLLCACTVFTSSVAGRSTVVFFANGSASLDEAGRGVIARAAESAANNPAFDIIVEGYAGSSTSPGAEDLASERASVVASALRADGVAANRVHTIARSPSNEAPGVAARRVEIVFSS